MLGKLPQPIPPVVVIRLLMVGVVVLALLAGYYRSALEVERQKNTQLQMKLDQT